MKEIDFIPQWYKTGRKRMLSYQRQYILVGILFVGLLVWSSITGGLVSRARAQVENQKTTIEKGSSLVEECSQLQEEISLLQSKADILSRIDNKTPIPQIIAELSYLTSDRIILSKLHIENEQVQPDSVAKGKGASKLFSSRNTQESSLPPENTVMRVVIRGIAAEASDVARLISRLEGSQYFFRIVPGYSRTKKVGDFMASEFEIGCYVANYVQEGKDVI